MSSTQTAQFLRQLGTMLESGLPALRCLRTLESSFPGRLRKTAAQLRQRVERGATLHEAMAARADLFVPIELALIGAGEQSGRLDRILVELADRREEQHRLKKSIVTRMIYPVILLHVGIGVGTLLAVISPGGGTAAGMRFLVKALGFIYGTGLGLHLAYKHRRRVPWFARAIDRLAYGAPVIGRIVKRLSLVRFCQAFEAMYVAGLSHPQTLSLAADACGNVVIENRIRQAVPMVSQGVDLGDALQGVRAFDPMVTGRLITGVQSGRIEETLIGIRKEAEADARTSVDRLAIVVPTLLYILIVVWIGFFVVLKFWLAYFARINEVLNG